MALGARVRQAREAPHTWLGVLVGKFRKMVTFGYFKSLF